MPSTSMRVDEIINDIVRNSPTLTEDDNSLTLDRDIADSGYLNPYQPLLDIFRLTCAADKVWITELTLIHKNIRSVRNLHISQSDVMPSPFTSKIFLGEIKGKMYYR